MIEMNCVANQDYCTHAPTHTYKRTRACSTCLAGGGGGAACAAEGGYADARKWGVGDAGMARGLLLRREGGPSSVRAEGGPPSKLK
jgi:hypothetical protein